MRKSPGWAIITLIALPLMAGAGFVFTTRGTPEVPVTPSPEAIDTTLPNIQAEPSGETDAPDVNLASDLDAPAFVAPIADAARRVTKKPFGIEIHPETSPVPNDRFNGFHVGVDFETFEDERDLEVPVYAICDGPLRFKKHAKGYGGVAVQACRLDGEDISVIYGHLNVDSIEVEPGEPLEAGALIGTLGEGFSEETDGVRKHLHLGVRKGLTDDIRGYVPLETDTAEYVDVLSRMKN